MSTTPVTAIYRGLAAALALAASACSTPPPVRYHTLLAPAAAPAAAAAAAAAAMAAVPFVIDVLPVGVPPQLDQPQLLVRQSDGGVALLEDDRWAGPLPDEVRGALSAQLARQLGTQDVAGLSAPPGRQVLRVRLQLRRLDAWPGQRVQLEAGWTLSFAGERDGTGNGTKNGTNNGTNNGTSTGSNNGSKLTCGGSLEVPASGAYPELVRAQQQALAQLAERIASDARRWAASQAAGCAG